ncbi:MAG: hypothetical protein ACO1OB_09305, partial [Archangium sp.]
RLFERRVAGIGESGTGNGGQQNGKEGEAHAASCPAIATGARSTRCPVVADRSQPRQIRKISHKPATIDGEKRRP